MRSSCCPCSFENQPKGRSRRSAKGAGVARRARAERKSEGETLVSERQDGLQFPLPPHTIRREECQSLWEVLRILYRLRGRRFSTCLG